MKNSPAGFTPIALPEIAGFINLNGPLYAKREDDRFVLGFRVEERHTNWGGICHGGWLGSLSDMLLCFGANVQGKLWQFLPTVNLTCDYLKPAILGDWIEGRMEVLRTTRNLCFTQGILSVEGAPILRCHGSLKVSRQPDVFRVPGFEDL